MNILFVYPKCPETFWSFKHALRFMGKKSFLPPLGLLTIASMLPDKWEKKLVDLNADKLKDKHLKWADYVFITAMHTQKKSADEVIKLCKRLGVKVVAGGPFFTACPEEFEGVDHLVLGEAEITLPEFLKDLERGSPKKLYAPTKFADMEKTPVPMWNILDTKKYSSMSIQFSRGCPFNCEFCQIKKLFGSKVRTKTKEQIIEELDSIYNTGWRDPIFFTDDNFIGNKHKLKTEILPAIAKWMKKKNYPFRFITQASMNLADDEDLMRMMVRAGFYSVFLGVETVDDDCLVEIGKFHNRNRDLLANVRKIHRFGLEVQAGFIIGFDNDKHSVFDKTIKFIHKSGINIVMVSLLQAVKGTELYRRLEKENRLISDTRWDNMDFTINFIPKMKLETLLDGYKRILRSIYTPKQYYFTLRRFLTEYNPTEIQKRNFNSAYLKKVYPNMKRLIKSIIILGILDKGRLYYWKLFFWSLFRRPELFAFAISRSIFGYHFRKVFGV
ncbi:B12-binding domain-containing radical SAM protein [Candidatus Woesearchaeota archaeon]|nr:B12-binding domain-containing radical SAM protein [Candidatus Woesearchaeota archaeon]